MEEKQLFKLIKKIAKYRINSIIMSQYHIEPGDIISEVYIKLRNTQLQSETHAFNLIHMIINQLLSDYYTISTRSATHYAEELNGYTNYAPHDNTVEYELLAHRDKITSIIGDLNASILFWYYGITTMVKVDYTPSIEEIALYLYEANITPTKLSREAVRLKIKKSIIALQRYFKNNSILMEHFQS